MVEHLRGRPPGFKRADAVQAAARLFWSYGYAGTSTRALSSALGISASSLYAAFGSKASLFEEAFRTYSARYKTIYHDAVCCDRISEVVDYLLVESALEFTQPAENHPGCVIPSAAMAASTETFNPVVHIAEIHESNERILSERVIRAQREGQLRENVDPAQLVVMIQTIWHGLSAHAQRGRSRHEVLETAHLAGAVLTEYFL